MAEIKIETSQWRLVEVGRVVLFTHGEYTGRLAAIAEIIDHKRVRLSFPSTAGLFLLTNRAQTNPPTGPGRRSINETQRLRSSPRHVPRQCHSYPDRDS